MNGEYRVSFAAKVSGKQFIKGQLHTTHVEATSFPGFSFTRPTERERAGRREP